MFLSQSTIKSAGLANSPSLSVSGATSLKESDGIKIVVNSMPTQDADGDTLTYSCWFNNTGSASVVESEATECKNINLTGMSFNSLTGKLTWDPSDGQDGNYRFKIVVTDNGSLNEEYFDVSVTDDL